jgi:outer membrane protein, multidrug efflux system
MAKRLTVLAIAVSLSACTVGPKLTLPQAPMGTEFVYADAPAEAVSQASFTAFSDPVLDALIARALAENTSVLQALARLDEARALAGLTIYSLFPTSTAKALGERNQQSGRDPFAFGGSGDGRPDATQRYEVGTDLAWEIDLFGSLRNQSAAIKLRAAQAQAALQDVQRSIVAEVAQGYFKAIGTARRLRIAERNLENLREGERIVEALLEAGRGTDLDLARAKSLRFATTAQLAQTEAELRRAMLALATLSNQPLLSVQSQLQDVVSLPAVPALRTVGTPQQWLQRRPDVRAAELALRAAYRDVGTEQAEYFPKLTLLGGFSSIAQERDGLFEAAAESWRYGPSLSWQFLNVGRVRQFVQRAQARAAGAMALYQETLLRALEETESSFANLRAGNQSAEALAAAAQEADKALALAKLRFEAGASDYLVVLDAERQKLSLDDQAAQADIARLSAYALVYRALAGDFVAAE